MRVDIKDVHYGNYTINKIYYGSNLVFYRSTIYDLNQNVYVFDLSKVANNLTLTLQDANSGIITDWGDGSSNTLLTHTYTSQGIYTVKTRQRISNYSTGDENTKVSLIKCINIDNTITDCSSMFQSCDNLTTAPTIPSSVTDCSFMFQSCDNLTTAPTIPSSVTDCSSMFQSCDNLTTAPTIPSSVTDCNFMFSNCTSLTTIPQANIDLMESVKTGINTTCTSYVLCYDSCTNITSPQTYATLSGLYSDWF